MASREQLRKDYEKAFGEKIPGYYGSEKKQSKEPALIFKLIALPFYVIAFVFNTFVRGPKCIMSADSGHLTISALFLLTSSVLGLFFIKDIGAFVESFQIFGTFTPILNGLIVIFFLVQLYRGSTFLSASGITGGHTINGVTYVSKESGYKSISNSSAKNSQNFGEIDKFKGYVNSRMSWMTHSQKEKYVKDLFGGKK